ncbi:WLM-domain-containing protein, partial [Piedraia hortae CBS 480.64]
RTFPSEHNEQRPLFGVYEHLTSQPSSSSALLMLRKAASAVKPIMLKRSWRVKVLTEFLPRDNGLLGLNINHGEKICLRLRYNSSKSFLRQEEVIDTLLHELTHIVWGPHDHNFERLLRELRGEYAILRGKGYTGEGFLGKGHKLGGRRMPVEEMRRQARVKALEREKKRKEESDKKGRRLGGLPPHLVGNDTRRVIADAVERRNRMKKGCGSTWKDPAQKLAQEGTRGQTVQTTQADDDDGIAEALFELLQEEEGRLINGLDALPSEEEQLAWAIEESNKHVQGMGEVVDLTGDDDKEEQWTCGTCTLRNPLTYLVCDACGTERELVPREKKQKRDPPQKKQNRSLEASQIRPAPKTSLGWNCASCGTFMEHCWWTCSRCSKMKSSS